VTILLADANIQGHIEILFKRMRKEPWIEFCDFLDLRLVSFEDAGLNSTDSDSTIWHWCEQHRVFLLTSNRNDDGPDSLESTICQFNGPQSVPVFTIGDTERLKNDRDYSDRVIWALLEYLLRIESLLGTGRLFLPGSD
jgi:hypothetical protein